MTARAVEIFRDFLHNVWMDNTFAETVDRLRKTTVRLREIHAAEQRARNGAPSRQ